MIRKIFRIIKSNKNIYLGLIFILVSYLLIYSQPAIKIRMNYLSLSMNYGLELILTGLGILGFYLILQGILNYNSKRHHKKFRKH